MSAGAQSVRAARPLTVARYLDVVFVIVAAPGALVLGAPVLGYVVGAGAWGGPRILAQLARRWIGRAAEPRVVLALNLLEAFARIWLLAGAIVAAGVAGGRADGPAGDAVILGAFLIGSA